MLIKFCRSHLLILIILLLSSKIYAQTPAYPAHIAYDIKAERIKFSNDAVKITWKMNNKYQGDFIVGRSEKEITSQEESLKASLAGVFNSVQEGILIDTEIQTGKKYYYIILAKDYLLKRQIDIIKNVNYTADGIALYLEPEPVQSIRADISDENSILLQWGKVKGDEIKYNIYRSKSPISSKGELGVAEKLITVEKNDTFNDKNISEYGTYFYAVTITDKNGVEYYTPQADKNYTTNGIYLKGKTLSTPLNIGAYIADKNSIIIKWIKAQSRTGREIHGYEIYRSDEIINSLFKLKFSKLIHIVDNKTTIYTDKGLAAGKYFYAVFPRYSDGTVDINFDQDSNYTKNPLLITRPFKITALNYETVNKKIILRWNYTGNSGNEIVSVFRSIKAPENSKSVSDSYIIATENIKAGKYIIENPVPGSFYYGLLLVHDNETVRFIKGRNITAVSVNSANETAPPKKEKLSQYEEKEPDESHDNSLDYIIYSTYYKGEYSLALKELKKFLKTTDDKHDRAKAKLFIAKTYIEQHEYEKSIKLLDSEDLKELFPEETRFWFEYAIRRLK
jgi:hypothetical protein